MMTLSMTKWVFVVLCCLLVLLCALGITWVIQYVVKKHNEHKVMEYDIAHLRWRTRGFDEELKGYNDRLHLIERKVDYLMEEHDKDAKPMTEYPVKPLAEQIAKAILTGIDKAIEGS